MREGSVAIQTRVSEEAVIIDLRTVAEDQLTDLADGINSAIRHVHPLANTETAPE